MTLLNETARAPLEELCVALDLETTGRSPQRDAIIEVGAVKFRGEEEVETFHSLVNPFRELSSFITQFTGITQREVNGAPSFGAVAPELAEFLGGLPIVGHSIAFDLAFLAQAGLDLASDRYDTLDLATVFLPSARGYSLSALVRAFGLTSQDRAHRAMADARACQRLFVALVRRAEGEAPEVLSAVASVAGRSPWPLRRLLQAMEGRASPAGQEVAAGPGILGVDTEALKRRLGVYRSLKAGQERRPVEEGRVEALLERGGLLSKAFPGYEYRSQQVEMAGAVTRALNQGHHLMVEAGTGVGKSVAYLLPAMLYAAENRCRVVVSTNTINLQQQLIAKDLPDLKAAVSQGEEGASLAQELQYAHLKGRGNYLCFRRWAMQAQSPGMSTEEARMLAKTLVWLKDTATGDREELNIPTREAHQWNRLSARGAGGCDAGRRELCFWRAARNRAEGAHVLVVNHALLLADLAMGGGLIPGYDHVIIDEAHHLEEEASRQFGYQLSPNQLEGLIEQMVRIAREVRGGMQGASLDQSRQRELEGVAATLEEQGTRLRDAWGRLALGLADFVLHHLDEREARATQHRVTRSSRAQPDWSQLELHWEGFNEVAGEAVRQAERLQIALEPLEYAPLVDVVAEVEGWLEEVGEVREEVRGFVVQPEEETVYWMSLNREEGMPTLSAAPLNVGPLLQERLFSKKESVVLTSATLSVQGTFGYQRERVGLLDGEELLLGSPFDYERAALLLVPTDMPEPRDAGYPRAVEESLVRVARAAGGGVLCLFTSHAALQTAREGIKATLEAEEIQVLGQGVDGSPRQIMEAASENPRTVLLGTASLWEGIDLPGSLLQVLMVARLPFPVPTEPLFAARSEGYNDPFNQYAVPQAVLRFRQGFGRLIRTSTDRGVVVVLDSRVSTKAYGSAFLNSIAKCTVRQVTSRALEGEVRGWLGE